MRTWIAKTWGNAWLITYRVMEKRSPRFLWQGLGHGCTWRHLELLSYVWIKDLTEEKEKGKRKVKESGICHYPNWNYLNWNRNQILLSPSDIIPFLLNLERKEKANSSKCPLFFPRKSLQNFLNYSNKLNGITMY